MQQERVEQQQNVARAIQRIDELFAACAKDRHQVVELSTVIASIASDVKVQFAAEMKERMAADEKFGNETQLRVTTELKAVESLFHQHSEQQTFQLQSLKENLTAAEEHTNELISAESQGLLSKMEELANVFRLNLDEEVQLRHECMANLRDEFGIHKKQTFDALTLEVTERESENHSLQVSLNEFRDKADMFKAEMDAVTRRVWDAFERHTHDIQVDDGLVRAGLWKMAPTAVTRSDLAHLPQSSSIQAGPQRSHTSQLGACRRTKSLVLQPVQFTSRVTSPSASARSPSGAQMLMPKTPSNSKVSFECLDRSVQFQDKLGGSAQLLRVQPM